MVPQKGCKVDEVTATYDLDSVVTGHETIDEGLLARWRGDDGYTSTGYRPLTDWYNKRLLRQVYVAHDRETMGGRVDHEYEALTSDESLQREEVMESLEMDGIDAAQVRDDMVSWGTMRKHLQECLDGDKPEAESETDWERDSIEKARSFAREKVTAALSSLASKGKLTDGDEGTVSVQIQLSCGVDECPTRVPLTVALERGYICEDHVAKIETTES